jgi:outer membrane protein OmpA-like peptidoglycan-associated protein
LPVSVLTAQRKRTERRGDAEVERYSLILFAFDDATVTNEHRQVLERIRTRMREGARVRILGMTDVMGASDYNLNLSRRRAEEVARALGLDKSVIEAVGARQPRFDNAAPEGRAYNRTVVIEVRSAK